MTDPKTIILTGASSGVGETLLKRFASQGHTICAIARSEDKLKTLSSEFPDLIHPFPCDVSRWDSVDSTAKTILERFPQPDILINNASVFKNAPFEQLDIETIDRIIDTNLKGTLYTTRAFLPPMLARKQGRILNISSVAGTHGIPGQAAYCASKHGVNGFADVIAQELKDRGVHVVSICPGGIDTPLWNDSSNPYPLEKNALIKTTEIADLVEFILNQPATTLYKKVVLFPTPEWH